MVIPDYISEECGKWLAKVAEEYTLETFQEQILIKAGEAWDRGEQARKEIERDGITIQGRYGLKANPACSVERDSRAAFLRALRELGLDLQDPDHGKQPPRP